MTIYNKSGTPFKLRGPNPIIKNQNRWNGFALHNFKFAAEIKEDKVPQQETIKKETFVEELENSKPEPKIVVTSPKIVIQKEEKPSTLNKIVMHCLPAIIKNHNDNIYGDSQKTIKFDKPFTFEGIIISQEDLAFKFWALAPHIGPGSIVYPKNKENRWWRTIDRQEKNDGWIIDCVPSDYQPSF